MTDALLLVDVQLNMFEPEPVHDGERLLEGLTSLLDAARDVGVPVVFVRNNGPSGAPDEAGTPGWEIHLRLQPAEGEPVVDKWESSSFDGTPLRELLADADTVVVAGLLHSTYDDEQPAAATIVEINRRHEASTTDVAHAVERWRGTA